MAGRFHFMAPVKAKARAIVYVDGFNLYYGALRGTSHRWLDLERLFTMLRNEDAVECIHYFTTLVTGPPKPEQSTYISALATLDTVNVQLGQFKTQSIKCELSGCTYTGSRTIKVPVEKRTDVQIALQMLDDAHADRCDRFVLVTGDSDLVPAVNRIKFDFPQKQVFVYVPATNRDRGAATELRNAAHANRTLPNNLLRLAQFPAEIPDGSGGILQKPPGW